MLGKDVMTPDLVNLRLLFRRSGFDLRLVGGCVRDLMAGLDPKDIDLCTDANPQEQIEIYTHARVRYFETGLDHGTITVVLDGTPYEVTSLRLDVETDGRRATVAYTRDWIKDLERRDFTINAMSITFDGELIDPFNGLDDLRNGLVKFVGDAETRIREDYLRILRWFRFRGRFGMDESHSTRAAIERLSPGLGAISTERVWSEVKRIISGNQGPCIMLEMHRMGVADHIDLPTDTLDQTSFPQEVAEITRNPVTLMVAMYGELAPQTLRRWKASGEEIRLSEKLAWAVEGRVSPFYAMAVLMWTRDHAVELAALQGLDAFQIEVIKEWPIPMFPVTGNDLIASGLSPGPEFSRRLGIMKNRWANSGYMMTKNDLMSMVFNS